MKCCMVLPTSAKSPSSPAQKSDSTFVISQDLLTDSVQAAALLKRDWSDVSKVTIIEPSWKSDLPQGKQRLQTILELYIKYDQKHIFEKWDSLSLDSKNAFVDDTIHKKALDHIERFRQIISSETNVSGVEPVEKTSLVDLDFCGEDYFKFDNLGREVLAKNKVGFILVAGGLGERLGATQIKISLPTESISGTSFLDLFLKHLQSFANPMPPLFIMTSNDTHEKTMALLKEMNVKFSVDKPSTESQVVLSKQETVPCFQDKSGKLAMKEPCKLLLKPHGHGDVHPLFRAACLDYWMNKLGIEYAVFFQDTNPSCFRVLPSLIGAAEANSLHCAVACVPRVPKSATGCIARSSQRKTIENFEYNIMNDYFSKNPELDSLFYLGNTNQLLVRLEPYSTNADGTMPEFCNPKYVSGSIVNFSSPARLECLMQDVMRFFPENKVMPILYRDSSENKTKTHVLYAPAKNSLSVAKRAWIAGTTDGSAASSEAAVYQCNCAFLREIGCTIEVDAETKVEFGEGIFIQPLFPSVVFDPRVLPFFSSHISVFPSPQKVFIGKNASIEFKGPGKIVCKSARIEGSLIVHAASPTCTIVLDGIVVQNLGRKVEHVEGDARLRVTHCSDVRIIECTENEKELIILA